MVVSKRLEVRARCEVVDIEVAVLYQPCDIPAGVWCDIRLEIQARSCVAGRWESMRRA